VVVEQLATQRLVKALDLPRRRGAGRLGQPLGDGVVAADPVEQHLSAAAEAGGELLAVVGEDFCGDAVAVQCSSTRCTVARNGTGVTPETASSWAIRRVPQRGCSRRIS
jgi:hypothetical protein